jgi:transketolase
VRNAFIGSLTARARDSQEFTLLVGDLGFGVVEEFSAEFPELFLNVGVAEQNMTGMAAGISENGRRVFTYSIANFPTMRALEQIRNDVAYHSFPVTIVSVGAGLDYGTLGYSHFAVEDIAVMRTLPGMKVYSPADERELETVMDEIFSSSGPSYLRLSKDSHAELPSLSGWIDASKPRKLLAGSSSTLILVTGTIGANVIEACQLIAREKLVTFDVYSLPQISPLLLEGVEWEKYNSVVTIEEHALTGGFGSAVLEYLSNSDLRLKVLRLGIDQPSKLPVGSAGFLREVARLDPLSIYREVLNLSSYTREDWSGD